ncbi:hypothetical protein F5Y06DRAFT_24774 [Hypoxylon sp. FL0890]|nr:hypothetical protein F5Y06DRAFT_24774 [Hypoxylon sp. FL0890]
MTVELTPPAVIALVALVLGLPAAALALFKCRRILQGRRANRQLQCLPEYSSPPSNEIRPAGLNIGVFTLVEIHGRLGREVWPEGTLRQARINRATSTERASHISGGGVPNSSARNNIVPADIRGT